MGHLEGIEARVAAMLADRDTPPDLNGWDPGQPPDYFGAGWGVVPLRHSAPARQKFIPAAELIADLTPPRWVIRGVLPQDALAVYFGEPATLKSLVALDMALPVAAGVSWRGRRTKPGVVFIVCGEGLHGTRMRVLAWCREHHVLPDDLRLYVTRAPESLTDPGTASQIRDEIAAALEHVPDEVARLVVVDTLSRNFGPADENATADMTRFIANLDAYLRAPFGATVVVVHHSGQADKSRARGNSVLRASVDAEFSFMRAGDVTTMRCTKMKDGAHPPELSFALAVHEFSDVLTEDGEPATAPYLVDADAPTAHREPSRAERDADLIRDALAERAAAVRRNLDEAGRCNVPVRVGRDDLRADYKAAKGQHFSRQRFCDAMAVFRSMPGVHEAGGFFWIVEASEVSEVSETVRTDVSDGPVSVVRVRGVYRPPDGRTDGRTDGG